jgi:hypothetical protein
MIRTCTFSNVTIGWANVASYPRFRAYLANRMVAEQFYIIQPPMFRRVIYNTVLHINEGVLASTIDRVMREMGDFLLCGDISIVELSTWQPTRLKATTPQDVLDHDTIMIVE